jgi:hypothetical protein
MHLRSEGVVGTDAVWYPCRDLHISHNSLLDWTVGRLGRLGRLLLMLYVFSSNVTVNSVLEIDWSRLILLLREVSNRIMHN